MDVNVSNVTNHLDADVLLPPRKRLLAGLKRQSCSESTSQCSHENNQSPSLSPSPSSQTPLTEFDFRVNNLLKSYKNGSNMSPEEIAKAARSAAVAAAKAAEAARAAAEEKAAVAAKAVAAAKTALDLVASISEDTSARDKHPRKNKLKKLKIAPSNEKESIANGAAETGVDCELSSEKTHSVIMDDKVSKSSKIDELEVTSCEVKTPMSSEDVFVNGRKRGRTKQKKLPLSICSFKGQTSPKELNVKKSLFSGRARADVKLIEVASTWKCQDF